MRTCLNCHISIEHKHKLAKFCSKDCKDKHWKGNNRESTDAAAKRYRESEHGKAAIAAKNPERCKNWRLNNPGLKRELDRQYHVKHQGDTLYLAKRAHHEAMRRARRIQATPKWLTDQQKQDIKNIYISCPSGHEVDHIVALQGKNVSGLHVPWNLQHLPSIVNRAKGNKVK